LLTTAIKKISNAILFLKIAFDIEQKGVKKKKKK
jgi:hypothetical protein